MQANYRSVIGRTAGLIVFLFFAFTCATPKVSAAPPRSRKQHAHEPDSFMVIEMELRMHLRQARPNEVIPLLESGLKALEAKAVPESQSKELVAVNLVSLMHLYRAIDEVPLPARRFELNQMKRRVLILADYIVKHYAENLSAEIVHADHDLTKERLKIFSEIYAAATVSVIRSVAAQLNRERFDGLVNDPSSLTSRIRHYLLSSRVNSDHHEALFHELKLIPDQTFLHHLGRYMIKLLAVHRGDPSRFFRRTLLTAATVGTFGYATVMLPTPFRETLLMGLVAGSAGYYRHQFDSGANRQFAEQVREFQSGRSLFRSVKDCGSLLRKK